LARHIERRVANSQRRAKALNYVLCAVVLILGIALLVSIIARWFIVL